MQKNRGLLSVALIPDGNRRYAKNKNLPIEKVYWESSGKLISYLNICKKYNIKNFIVWVLSSDNFNKRNSKEKRILMDVFYKRAKQYLNDKIDGINVYFIGNIYKLPNKLKKLFKKIEEKYNITNEKTKIYLLVNYSGEQELISAFKKTTNLKKELWLKVDIDYIIRTGGEYRLSNFAIFQSRYAELYFSNKMFPEFTLKDFKLSILDFFKRERRLGN